MMRTRAMFWIAAGVMGMATVPWTWGDGSNLRVDGISGASYTIPTIPRPALEVRSIISDWLQTHWFMSLATASPDGTPHVSGVTFYVDNLTVYFRTTRTSTKAVDISNNPKVAFTVWDQVDDMAKLKALQVLGNARFLEGEERDRIAGILAGSPGSTASNLEKFFASKGIQPSYTGTQMDFDKYVIVAVQPLVARWNDNTLGMGHSDVYHFESAPASP